MTTVGRSDFMERKGKRAWDGDVKKRHKYYKNYFGHLRFLPKPGLWPKDEKKIPFSCHTPRN